MPAYKCELCEKKFTKKTDYECHKSRKISCIDTSVEDIIEEKVEAIVERKLEELNVQKNSKVKIILNLVENLHSIMRKYAITGQKAYYDIIRLLLLRFMDPHIKEGGRLENLLNPNHYTNIEEFNSENIKYLHFKELCFGTELDFSDKIYLVWDMLSSHSLTKGIFPAKQTFNSQPDVLDLACRKIYDTLETINFDELDEDVGGAIYEHFINKKGGGGGQSLGQYFTPRKLIHLIMRLNKEIFPNKKTPKNIYDPCAGTAGFLMEMYKVTRVPVEEIYGGELEPDTFATCLMNIMLATGSIGNIQSGDSFKNNSLKLYDWIGTNPPFGMKGLKYEEVLANVSYKQLPTQKGEKLIKTCIPAKEMYPIKTNDGSALFLQHCIAKLAIGGTCNIVLPAGQLLTGKNAYKDLRKYLIEECILKAVLSVPGGAFETAGVATSVLFFTKRKTQCTGDVDFYETDQSCTELIKIGSVHASVMAEKNYVLDWKYYRPVENYKPIDSTWEIKTLDEVCKFISGKKHNVSEGKKNGAYELLCSSTQGKVKYLDTFDYEGPYIAIGTGGAANVHLKSKFNISTHFKVLDVMDNSVLHIQYLYLYLKSNLEKIDTMFRGCGLKNLDMNEFKLLNIPIPSIEKQQEIISTCEIYDKQIQTYEKQITDLEVQKEKLYDMYFRRDI